MGRGVTKGELLASQAHYQGEATAMRMLVRLLSPRAGFYFTSSPRAYSAFLFHVDDDGFVTYYDATRDRQAWVELSGELWRLHSDGPMDIFTSLIDALQEANKFRNAIGFVERSAG